MTKLSEIEGIGEKYASKLNESGVTSIEDLLKKGSEKKGRREIAEKSSVSEKLILEWVNRADLTRVKGVSTQYADLLEHAGVDSVPELAQRNAANLTEKMESVNSEKNLVRRVPPLKSVEDWIDQAKALPKAVFH